MNFNTLEFAIFFAVVFPLYLLLNKHLKTQNHLLLVASYIFYAWFDPRFVLLLAFTSLVDFYCGLVIDSANHHYHDAQASRRIAILTLILSLTSNLAVLGFFKYFNFFVDSFVTAAAALGFSLDVHVAQIILPAGISFYTFQSISYVVDIYDRRLRATTQLHQFLLYVSYFPHLVAGPILRSTQLMPKILRKRVITPLRLRRGIYLAAWGFFQKMVIADNMAPIVDATFRNPSATGGMLLVAIYAFAIQIYCDFAGYTNIARGISRMMGIELIINFNLPYLSRNPSEFWQRWHISLSTWLRDYLYIKLGGNRKGGAASTARNLLLTMLLGGLWHGASMHFVIWGAYHGLLLTVHHAVTRWFPVFRRVSNTMSGVRHWASVFVFFHFTCLGWLLFRVKTLDEFWIKLQTLVFDFRLTDIFSDDGKTLGLYALPLLVFELFQYSKNDLEPWRRWPILGRVAWMSCLVVAIVVLRAKAQHSFIYFRF